MRSAKCSRATASTAKVRHDVTVTQTTPANLPPDPGKYDEYRNVAARKRGLEQPYIDGGEDPEIEETLRRERPYVQILIAMVVIIVLAGFVLGVIGAIITAPRLTGVASPPPAPLPSAALDAATWDAAHDELVAFLRDLIRIPSINPPDPPGPEMDAAMLHRRPPPRRGPGPGGHRVGAGPRQRHRPPARRRHRRRRPDALLLLSHLDVVPANAADGWTHDPFAADIADGYVWGRGAVDMKQMVALETLVVLLLARRARAAGLDPARDPIPGLRRDVLFACTADEEAGGREGAGWLADHRPETLRAAGALNEAAACRWSSAGAASTRSRSPRRATRSSGSTSTARGATGRCPATTTPPSWPPRSCAAWPSPASRA